MSKRVVSLLLALCCFVFVTACSKTKYPQGFPKLVPCKVKVLDDAGSPMEGAHVVFHYGDSKLSKWGTAGVTGADGTVIMRTRGYEGAPAGSCTILVEKRDPPVKDLGDGKFEAGIPGNQLDERLYEPETSPFSADIAKGQKGVLVIDLSSESVKAE